MAAAVTIRHGTLATAARRLPWTAVTAMTAMVAAVVPPPLPAAATPLRLSSLQVSTGTLRPPFSPDVFHYALPCNGEDTLSVRASSTTDTLLRLNGQPGDGTTTTHWQLQPAPDDHLNLLLLPDPAADEDGATLAGAGAADATTGHTSYTLHCIPPDFPEVEIVHKQPGRGDGLLLLTPYHPLSGAMEKTFWLAMLDDNGVPRFRRRVPAGAHNFRWHPAARLFSYNQAQPNDNGPVVLLDDRLQEVARVGTVAGLAPAMMHDFLITPEGNYLFIVNQPAVRDFSSYPPVDDDRPQPATNQHTVDAIIQEVTPDGQEVFRWNAWHHLKLADCRWTRFPKEYAKLNSLYLDADGNILASFRACSTVLKIHRPTGRVLWQLGGSDPAAPDPFDTTRPTFARTWYRPDGDPHRTFCSQHSAVETPQGHVLLFDNGQCPPAEGGDRLSSRVVLYRLEPDGTASFLRHHEPGRWTPYAGAVTPLPNGNWLISWGPAPDSNVTISEVNTHGHQVFALRLSKNDNNAMSYRVWRYNTSPTPHQHGENN